MVPTSIATDDVSIRAVIPGMVESRKRNKEHAI